MRSLTRFTAQTENDIGTNIGVSGGTRQSSVELLVILSPILHGTACLVGYGNNTIDCREILENSLLPNALGDIPICGCGAIDRGNDTYVVSGAITATTPVKSHEMGGLRRAG